MSQSNCYKFQSPCRESNPDLRFTKPMLDRSSSGGVQAVKESNPRRQALETRLRPARGLFGRGAPKARGRGPLMVTRPPEPRSDCPDQRRMRSGEPRSPPRISSARPVTTGADDVHSQKRMLVRRWALATAATACTLLRVIIVLAAPTSIAAIEVLPSPRGVKVGWRSPASLHRRWPRRRCPAHHLASLRVAALTGVG